MERFNTRLLFSFLLFPFFLFSQTNKEPAPKKEVEILNADFLKLTEVNGRKITKLIGNVQLKQEQVLMWCDSAEIAKDSNSVEAWGNVHIQNDTVDAFSKYLKYEGNKKFATLRNQVLLSDNKMKLYTEELFYNTKDKTAYYLNGGKVLRKESVITSLKGYYFNKTSEVYFKKNVLIIDTNYRLTSDTLKYNINTDISTFFGNTKIINKDSKIRCNTGWYDSKKDLASFGKGTIVDNPPQTLITDSLYYERYRGFGKSTTHFRWIDSSMDVEIIGNYGEYFEERQFITATQKPLLIYKTDKDSLLMTGDTLRSMHHSKTDTTRNFFCYHHARIFKPDMQGVCDSIFYSFTDSTFRMFRNPIVWSNDIQMTADTIFMTMKNKKAEKLYLRKHGYIVSPSEGELNDQIKGKDITGYFANNELEKMLVEKNAESLYFGKDDKNAFVGANKALCNRMWLYFKDKKMNRIVFIQKPEAVFTPMKQLKKEDLHLADFRWLIELKPKSKEEFFK